MDNYYMITGLITAQAGEEIEAIGGSVKQIAEDPTVWLVMLPRVTFEAQDEPFASMKIIGYGNTEKRVRLIWSGNHPGPELTSGAKTKLECEHDRSYVFESANDPIEDDGHLF